MSEEKRLANSRKGENESQKKYKRTCSNNFTELICDKIKNVFLENKEMIKKSPQLRGFFEKQ
jgi:hypothetical protein